MNPLWLLLVGMVVVVGGVLVLRLHAFLALILGALVVAVLTPAESTFVHALRANAMAVKAGTPAGGPAVVETGKRTLDVGGRLLLVRPTQLELGAAELRIVEVRKGEAVAQETGGGGAVLAKAGPARPGDLVVKPHHYAAAERAGKAGVGDRIAEGFGRTVTGIGILIALASIVGEALMLSGGAEKIVASSRRAFGDSRVSLAFLLSGFVLGIPVFFDTVFYLLIPLGKVMRVRSGRDYTLYVLCIVAGATMTHSLVPPTPGPLFVAEALKVDLATMILAGLVVAAVSAVAGYAYAVWVNRRVDVPLRESAGLKADELDVILNRDERTLPPLWLSLTPIFLPVVLISAAAFAPVPAAGATGGYADLHRALQQLGDKNISMTIAAAIALLMVARSRTGTGGRDAVGKGTAEALASAGVIILITSAGGAFGQVLQQTDIAATIKGMVPAGKLALLPLVFLVTMTIRIAQGSATVAMVTAAGIASPLAAAGGLGFHPVYLALAIGAGSKPGMWMNDSGFWIIGKTSGFTEGETLRTATVMMSIMGFAALAAVMLGAWLLPMQ